VNYACQAKRKEKEIKISSIGYPANGNEPPNAGTGGNATATSRCSAAR
jgi:hypothetical protein